MRQTKGLGIRSARALIDIFGSQDEVFEFDRTPQEILEHPKLMLLRKKLKGSYRSQQCLAAALREKEYIQDKGINCIPMGHRDYPNLLLECVDAPLALMIKGSLPEHKYWLSIVGSRRATPMGLDFCRTLIRELAPLNPVIVSGLAKGIDLCAHQTALDLGLPTVACLAHGLNQIYPKEHYATAREIEKKGALITEFWSKSDFHSSNFLQRNRIIAGLSHATVVIESGQKGGGLITAQFACGYDREVFAVPGNPSQINHQGCNNLIKNHQAHMITEAGDLARVMGWSHQKQPLSNIDLDTMQRSILGYVKHHPYAHKDELSRNLQVTAGVIQGAVLNLELLGLMLTQSGCCVLSNRGLRALDA